MDAFLGDSDAVDAKAALVHRLSHLHTVRAPHDAAPVEDDHRRDGELLDLGLAVLLDLLALDVWLVLLRRRETYVGASQRCEWLTRRLSLGEERDRAHEVLLEVLFHDAGLTALAYEPQDLPACGGAGDEVVSHLGVAPVVLHSRRRRRRSNRR